MLSEVLKRSYDQNLEVKITQRSTGTFFIGIVVGGSRSVSGQTVDYLSEDGFYSYSFKLISGYEHLLEENSDKRYITVLVSDIENVEIIE